MNLSRWGIEAIWSQQPNSQSWIAPHKLNSSNSFLSLLIWKIYSFEWCGTKRPMPMIQQPNVTCLLHRQTIHEAAHIFTPMNKSIPMLVSLLLGISITQDNETALCSCWCYIHPSPVGKESNSSMVIGSNCRKDNKITLPALVSTVKENRMVWWGETEEGRRRRNWITIWLTRLISLQFHVETIAQVYESLVF